MNILNFIRRDKPASEVRQAPYTDAITAAIIAAAGTSTVDSTAASALETAAGVYARAMASATVEGASVDASMLAGIGRDLVTRGESLIVEYEGAFVRAASWEVGGRGPVPADWRYSIELPVPDGRLAIVRRGDEVAHPRYSTDRDRPWIGVAPLSRASHIGEMLARMESSLSAEMTTAVGYLLPIPSDGQDETVESLREDIANLKGRTALIETTVSGWGEGRGSAPGSDCRPNRIGPAPPDSLARLHEVTTAALLAALGVPVELVHVADGTGQREAWRRFLHGTLAPIGDQVGEELSNIAGRPVRLTWESLFASDVQGRARAFQSMVGGGMAVEDAAILSGLIMEDG